MTKGTAAFEHIPSYHANECGVTWMQHKATIFFFAFLAVTLLAAYYVFVDTLSLTEIMPPQSSFSGTMLLGLLDFDTGLTRYDCFRIHGKMGYWKKRINEVSAIPEFERQRIEQERLLAEMMQDPALRKFAQKTYKMGAKRTFEILQAASLVTLFR